jgi:predicted cobalt transporter CbtA
MDIDILLKKIGLAILGMGAATGVGLCLLALKVDTAAALLVAVLIGRTALIGEGAILERLR